MKEINLRDYYPHYKEDKFVEVPDEVAELPEQFRLSEAAYYLCTYRYKAFYSLDYGDDIEREALYPQPMVIPIPHKRSLSGAWQIRQAKIEIRYHEPGLW